eukprot:TRINITY_DN2245_c0_g1_i4.p3 TRINITY_DN2245_c0_g1~~TRINITY_DN2245_c0_g1_i4.p3  ORF type:complete len:135 (+),score=39.28 TRINITY_DN2245_c0_g1_i4:2631-3035(+)
MADETFFSVVLKEEDFAKAIELVTNALKANGFGILTTIDAQGVFKNKINLEHRPYTILGACNPSLASKAIAVDANVGALLPCSIVVEKQDDGKCRVAWMNPLKMMQMIPNEALKPIAQDAHDRLEKTAAALQAL